MSDETLTVGQTVARARAAAGMTVAQVAAQTRIRASVISDIEADDFRACGGDVYAKGHLKSIATSVGIDPAELAAQFDVQRGAVAAVAEPVAPIDQPTQVMTDGGGGNGLAALAGTLGASMSGGRRGANWTAVMALALVVIVGIGLISFLQRPQSSTPVASNPTPSSGSGTSSSPTAPSTSPSTTPSTQPSPSTSSPDVVAQADGVTVKLAATGGASWMRVTNAAGKTLFEGTLNRGQTKTFRDKTKVKLLVGNAGAVSLKVNGRDLGAPGASGQVVKVEFVPGDPTVSAA